MQIRYFIFFEKKSEKTEFLKMLGDCETKMEAINKLAKMLPNAPLNAIREVVENFEDKINKK